MIYTSMEELIGKTPLLELTKIEKELSLPSRLFAKLELFNPAGSIKDRAALNILNEAEKEGILKKGSVIIEPTSGNTGIGLAAIGAGRGYRVVIVMPDTMSPERQKLMRAYGARVVLTDGALGMQGAIDKAKELNSEIKGSIIAGQFTNSANAAAHEKTTGPELYADMDGDIDAVVCGVGTGGTVTGIGHYLKKVSPKTEIIAVEPDTSAVLSGESAGKHAIQGIGAGFIPEVLDVDVIDRIIKVSKEEAYLAARMLAEKEGVLVGISSGAALFAALKTASDKANAGRRIAVILPDTGERYLSSDLYN